MEGNQKTRIQKFMGGNKKGYQTAFHMAWPAVMESFFIALAGMVDSLMVSSMGPEAVAAVGLTTQPSSSGCASSSPPTFRCQPWWPDGGERRTSTEPNPGAFNGSGLYPGGGDADQYGLRVLCRSHHPALRGKRGYPGGSRPVFLDHHGRDDVQHYLHGH